MGLTGSQRAEKVGFTYTPTNYTPDPVWSESTNKVSAHLKGIDNALPGAGGAVAASAVSYDNSVSGLSADDVQDAIDEIVNDLGNYVLAPTASTTAGNIPQYQDVTGKQLTNGLVLVTTVGNPGLHTRVPTEKAVRDTFNDQYEEGLRDNRPLPGNESYRYYATDTHQYFVDNGIQWREIAAVGTGSPTIYERHVATAGQTVFNLSSKYTEGYNALQVYVNGNRQTVGASNSYVETDDDTITFNVGLDAGDEVIFLQHSGGSKNVITARQDFTATGGQTVFNLSFSYRIGHADILVYSSGVLQRAGASYDYVETDETTITFNSGRALNEQIAVLRVGANDAGTVGLYERHVATAGQTVFDLAGAYPVGTNALLVFKNGMLQSLTADYTETDGDTVTLVNPANLNDVLIFRIPYGDTESATAVAASVHVDTTNFDYILSAADDTAQKALNTLDDHSHYSEGLLSSRPAANINGRWYRSTDDAVLAVDNGSLWIGVGGAATAVSAYTDNFDNILSASDQNVQAALDTLNDHDHYSEGLLASRPSPGIEGRWYRATDTNQLFVDTGTVWKEVAAIGTGAPTIYERHVATAGQTVFNLSSQYDTGVNALQVFRNGNRQTVGASNDYVETDSDTVTFNAGLDVGDEVVFIQFSGGAKSVITARADFTATAGQTAFDLSFTYRPGYQDIQVYSGGLIQRLGGAYDYVETDSDTVTFNVGRALNENVTILRVGANEAGTVGLYEKHTAAGGQTVFNLVGGSYPTGTHSLLVFKNGQLLVITDDYVETDGDTVTLTAGALAGDKLVFRVLNGDTELSAHDIDYHSDYPTGLHPYEASTAGVGSPNILLASESGKTISNVGTPAENYNTLPSASAGLRFTFICEDANGIRVTAAAGDTVRIVGDVSAAAGYARSTTIGSAVTFVAVDDTQWIAISALGTWTVV